MKTPLLSKTTMAAFWQLLETVRLLYIPTPGHTGSVGKVKFFRKIVKTFLIGRRSKNNVFRL